METVDFVVEMQKITENLENQKEQEIERIINQKFDKIKLDKDDVIFLQVSFELNNEKYINPTTLMKITKMINQKIGNFVIAVPTDYEIINKENAINLLEYSLKKLKGE